MSIPFSAVSDGENRSGPIHTTRFCWRRFFAVTAGVLSCWGCVFVMAGQPDQGGTEKPQAPQQSVADEPASGALQQPPIGAVVRNLHFKDIRYVLRSIEDLGEHRAYVLVMSSVACPLVQRYYPKLKELDEQYDPQEVQFVCVNVAPEDTIADMAQVAVDFDVPFPFVKDVDGSVVAALGVRRTPEVVVLDSEFRLRYRGRIDDQYRISGSLPKLRHDSLRLAIDDVLASREVAMAETPVDGCVITPFPAPPEMDVTWYDDIQPLVQKHCIECHGRGGESTMSLASYKDAASNAAMIAEVVSEQRMPPWLATHGLGLLNERKVPRHERRQFVAWANAGAPEGEEREDEAPVKRTSNTWQIGKPDLIIKAGEQQRIPASGELEYMYLVMPFVFRQDTWISGVEIRPSNPKVVHHAVMGYGKVGRSVKLDEVIGGYVPGNRVVTAAERGFGEAIKIPANSVIGMQIHYVTTGKKETNRMSVGFTFPRDRVMKEIRSFKSEKFDLSIPKGERHHEMVSKFLVTNDIRVIGVFSHMHWRGKDVTMTAIPPEGDPVVLLSVPNYRFDWQERYSIDPNLARFSIGTEIEICGHYDNSAFNPYNPDPATDVTWGIQSDKEMFLNFVYYTNEQEHLDIKVDPRTGWQVQE